MRDRQAAVRLLTRAAVFFAAIACLQAQPFGLGRPAADQEIAALDITVAPDGTGLPPGQGTATDGARIYERQCRECHGPEGQGSEETGFVGKPQDLLLEKPKKTVGSYWPYATTLFDYIRRAMPFKTPGSLSDEQVYAVTAYILSLNGLIEESETLNGDRLREVKMPNNGNFIPDPRPDTPASPAEP